jgi:hypothetical protein
MGKKIQIGNCEAVLLTDNEKDIKNKIIDYLYNTLNLSKYRYEMLNNIQKLKYLQENEHWVSPNYKGHSYFLIFMSIYNKSYCVIINRKKLSYHKNQIDLHTTFIVRLLVNTNSNMFTGSIFEGKIIQKDNDNYFLIQDCFYLMGKSLVEMEINQKMLYLNDIVNTNLVGPTVCLNFNFKLNKLYKYNELPKLITEIIPSCSVLSNGLIFYPKISGITILFVEKKIEKIDIESSQQEKIESRSHDLIFNFKDFLNSRVYSYEKEGKLKKLWLKKAPADIPDVFDVYENKESNKIGIAHIPNLKISLYCSENIKNDFVLYNCIFNNKFQKWIPLSLVKN